MYKDTKAEVICKKCKAVQHISRELALKCFKLKGVACTTSSCEGKALPTGVVINGS